MRKFCDWTEYMSNKYPKRFTAVMFILLLFCFGLEGALEDTGKWDKPAVTV